MFVRRVQNLFKMQGCEIRRVLLCFLSVYFLIAISACTKATPIITLLRSSWFGIIGFTGTGAIDDTTPDGYIGLGAGPMCWGANGSGQLGIGHTFNRTYPIAVPWQMPPPMSIAAGNTHNCAAHECGNGARCVTCWGSNAQFQLGNTQTGPILSAEGAQFVSGAGLGNFFDTGIANDSSDDLSPGQLVAGDNHTCLIVYDRAAGNASHVMCWGGGSMGQNGINASTPTPQYVTDGTVSGNLTGATFIAAGGDSNCAVLFDGSVWCWGDNATKKIGNSSAGANSNIAFPVEIAAGTQLGSIDTVAVGRFHACALELTGNVVCWGSNSFYATANTTNTGNLTFASNYVLEAVGTTLGNVLEIAAGYNHTCALTSDGTVHCWGANAFGQLGTNNTIDNRLAGQVLTSTGVLTNVVGIAAGANMSCAFREDLSTWCWGDNSQGQLGTGASGASQLMAVKTIIKAPDRNQQYVPLAFSGSHACGLPMVDAVLNWTAAKGASSYTYKILDLAGAQVCQPGTTSLLSAAFATNCTNFMPGPTYQAVLTPNGVSGLTPSTMNFQLSMTPPLGTLNSATTSTITGALVTFSWTASDSFGVSKIEFYERVGGTLVAVDGATPIALPQFTVLPNGATTTSGSFDYNLNGGIGNFDCLEIVLTNKAGLKTQLDVSHPMHCVSLF